MRVRLRRRRNRVRLDRGPSILDAIQDQQLFAPWFRDRDSWRAWFAFLSAMFALPMTNEQFATYRECTGRSDAPDEPAKEGWLICGRRAGKSFVLALIAVYLACFRTYTQYLQPGERGTIVIIAADRKQARVILRYISGLLKGVPMLKRLIESETKESFDLANSVTIEVATASFRSTRGYTIIAALLDEAAFWRSDDSSNPDFEILNALRPAMATIPSAVLLVASSPYSRKGILWTAWKNHFGKDHDPILVWKAPTRTMNATVPQSLIDEALANDPAAGAAEYLAEFRADIEAFINREIIEACVSPGIRERDYVRGTRYVAFCDPSGGSGTDSMTLGVAHKDGDGAILDLVREIRPPFSPRAAVAEFCTILKQYRVVKVVGDRYGGEFVAELFKEHGVKYEAAARAKSDIYRDALGLLNSGKADLLDNDRLVTQIASLERRVARGGKDSIDHPPGAHDDLCNSALGVLVNLLVSKSTYTLDFIDGDREERQSPAAARLASIANIMGGGGIFG